MATATIEYDGRSTAMRKLIELFITLGGKVTEQKPTKSKKGSLVMVMIDTGTHSDLFG